MGHKNSKLYHLMAVAGYVFLQPLVNVAVVLAFSAGLYRFAMPGGLGAGAAAERLEALLWQQGNLILIITNALVLAVVWALARRSGIGLARQAGLSEPLAGKSQGLWCLLAGLSANFWLSFVLNSGLVPESLLASYDQASGVIEAGPWALQLAAVAIAAPLTEEILFRGLIQRRLGLLMPPGAAVVFQGLLFGALHGHPLWVAYAALLGFFLGYIRLKSGSLRATLAFHVAFNLSTYAFQLCTDRLAGWPLALTGIFLLSGALFMLAVTRIAGGREKLV